MFLFPFRLKISQITVRVFQELATPYFIQNLTVFTLRRDSYRLNTLNTFKNIKKILIKYLLSEVKDDLPSRNCCSNQKNRSENQSHHLRVRQKHEDRQVNMVLFITRGQNHTLQRQVCNTCLLLSYQGRVRGCGLTLTLNSDWPPQVPPHYPKP